MILNEQVTPRKTGDGCDNAVKKVGGDAIEVQGSGRPGDVDKDAIDCVANRDKRGDDHVASGLHVFEGGLNRIVRVIRRRIEVDIGGVDHVAFSIVLGGWFGVGVIRGARV